MNTQEEYEAAAAALRAYKVQEGTLHMRNAALAGHDEAQNQLARIYFGGLKSREDLAALESAAQGGDHVALFVLAMSLIEGRLLEKDTEKAIAALQIAARSGNYMAASMLHHSQQQ